MSTKIDSFKSRASLTVGSQAVDLYRLDALTKAGIGDIDTLPFSIRILLENLLRHEDGSSVTREDIEGVANWDAQAKPSREIAFRPARVILQDFTGVPAVVDLAAMRDAFADMGCDAKKLRPLQPVDLVIDHSVQVDTYARADAFDLNVKIEYQRNKERYQFLRWGQGAFEGFRVVPPGTGIVHQVNLEYLARVVFSKDSEGNAVAYPDTLVGTDSHTTMINGLGVLGWGVGGIEAEAAMLGQPISMLVPQVVGFKLTGKLVEGATATDVVLMVVEMLRKKGVVGKFVEYFGNGLDSLSLPDRATIANMAPEYGATMGFFPMDNEALDYMRFTGRSDEQVAFTEAYLREQGIFRTAESPDPRFTDVLVLDLGDVVPSIAGPKRPQDRIALGVAKRAWRRALVGLLGDAVSDVAADQLEAWADQKVEASGALAHKVHVKTEHGEFDVTHGQLVIAAITSCTNTSNPEVMVAAGLLARNAVECGLTARPWVKTSLAPGSQVVTDYLQEAGLMEDLEALGFFLVGYGCTTCIGNSGPIDQAIANAVKEKGLVVTAVLSGNRNFEGRISPVVRANYLASPPLVVAYAIAGTVDIDFEKDALGIDSDGQPVFLRDVWPSQSEITDTVRECVNSDMFKKRYAHVLEGTQNWRELDALTGDRFAWDDASTYIRRPPFFDGIQKEIPPARGDIKGARVLVKLGDSVTTDHISPAGAIAQDSPAGAYLQSQGVKPINFNSYGSRRGNHEVMMRGTFANIRLRNQLAPGTEGGITRHLPDGEQMSIFDAAQKYQADNVALVIIAGTEYGSGSSRDWAAKGTCLLGVHAVLAESYERIHRSNLIGMGVLPLEFSGGDTIASLGLTGEEVFEITGIAEGIEPGKILNVKADDKSFTVLTRVDTPQECEYIAHGGILPYVLRNLARSA